MKIFDITPKTERDFPKGLVSKKDNRWNWSVLLPVLKAKGDSSDEESSSDDISLPIVTKRMKTNSNTAITTSIEKGSSPVPRSPIKPTTRVSVQPKGNI